MKIGDHTYFAPGKSYSDLKAVADPSEWYTLFFERLEAYFLEPVEILNRDKKGFAALIVLFAAIEYLAHVHDSINTEPGRRFIEWTKSHNLLPDDLTGKIYGTFRSGLSHNGQILDGLEACYEISTAVGRLEGKSRFVVNPHLLLTKLRITAKKLCEDNAGSGKNSELGARVRSMHEKDIHKSVAVADRAKGAR